MTRQLSTRKGGGKPPGGMSNPFEDGLRDNAAQLQMLSNAAAMQQRNKLIAAQEETRAEMERQTQVT